MGPRSRPVTRGDAGTECMRNGRELILATKPFAEDRAWTSWWHLLSTALLLVAALAVALVEYPAPVRILASVAGGLLLLRLFVIYHDQQHQAILPKSRLAAFMMRLFGIWALSPNSIWKSSHDHHHKHNSKLFGSHIGSFPIMTRARFLKASRQEQRQYLFIRHPLTILCGYFFMFLYGMCFRPFLNSPRRHWECLVAIVLHVAIGVGLFLFGGWKALVLVQTLPHFIAYAIGTYLFYVQHNFTGVSLADSGGWTYEKAALESSSFLRTNPIMAWFTANIGYHHIHHLNPKIPFYRLPEVMRSVPELQSPKTTSFAMSEIRRSLRLKVWDADAQRMVGLNGQ